MGQGADDEPAVRGPRRVRPVQCSRPVEESVLPAVSDQLTRRRAGPMRNGALLAWWAEANASLAAARCCIRRQTSWCARCPLRRPCRSATRCASPAGGYRRPPCRENAESVHTKSATALSCDRLRAGPSAPVCVLRRAALATDGEAEARVAPGGLLREDCAASLEAAIKVPAAVA
jgi:hypothetical protein